MSESVWLTRSEFPKAVTHFTSKFPKFRPFVCEDKLIINQNERFCSHRSLTVTPHSWLAIKYLNETKRLISKRIKKLASFVVKLIVQFWSFIVLRSE